MKNRGYTEQAYFWLALLGHLLLFLSFTVVLKWQWLREREDAYRPQSEKPAQAYTPAYLYHEPVKELPPIPTPIVKQQSKRETDKAGIEKPAPQKQTMQTKTESAQTASDAQPLTYSTQTLRENVKGKPLNKPLLKLLYDATAAAFIYPKIAKDFNQTGTATIRFLVYPNGFVTNVSVAKSSGFDILDNAALDAIRRISPVRDVNLYIQKPEYVEAHIIFN